MSGRTTAGRLTAWVFGVRYMGAELLRRSALRAHVYGRPRGDALRDPVLRAWRRTNGTGAGGIRKGSLAARLQHERDAPRRRRVREEDALGLRTLRRSRQALLASL